MNEKNIWTTKEKLIQEINFIYFLITKQNVKL